MHHRTATWGTALTLCSLLLTASIARAAEPPVIDLDQNAPKTAAMQAGGGGNIALGAVQNAQRVDSLGASFLNQRMAITQSGQKVSFWGARITSLDQFSPLKALGVRPGDVITRLDGLPIGNGMHQDNNGEWISPELDRHFGDTEVRFIISGTTKVNIGKIMISNISTPNGGNSIEVAP